jgi:hypothetical protein
MARSGVVKGMVDIVPGGPYIETSGPGNRFANDGVIINEP